MKVAIDKNCINKIKDFKEFEYIYIYDDETIQELFKINLHCINKKALKNIEVDINLTNYEINSIKKADIDDKEWRKLPKTKDNKFAIIVPNYNNDHGEYNGKTFLRNCLDSILNQTYRNFYLIFVDDMSTDTSIETVKNYNDDRIHIIQNRRKRYNGGSRNVGIEFALDNFDFDYFCFLDSDDWWKDNTILDFINKRIYNNEMMTLGCEGIGVPYRHYNDVECYEDLYALNNKLWCTAWSKVIRKDKIVYFEESTLMEDRVWTYKLADNLDFDKVVNSNKLCYCWNRTNTDNSVSLVRSEFWDACAWCHIGHQLQLITQMKHKEMIPKIQERINQCIDKINRGIYQQY